MSGKFCMTGFSKNKAGARAFTLMELLVVIAIIAIVAALLWTALARVKPQGPREKQNGIQLKKTSTVLAFACEDAGSINDGIFLVEPAPGTWRDSPATQHSRGGTFSFADGHVEYWKWKSDDLSDPADLARVQAALPEP